MNLTRREIKYQIPLEMVEPICEFIEPFCEIDKYSARSPDLYYTINSLYLDNHNMLLLERKRANLARRYSMRIRSYGENPIYPAFMEIKAKADLMINKRRCAITTPDTIEFMKTGVAAPDNPDLKHPVLQNACYKMLRLGLKPVMMTQYRRKAYFGMFDEYSRITFDRQMRCYPETEFNIMPIERRLVNYDHEEKYRSLDGNIVLELKCELKVPPYFSALIKKFNLTQSSFSKFDSSWAYLNDEVDPNFGFMNGMTI
jgi:SPX domain protein involved in polyphosphate accumulation